MTKKKTIVEKVVAPKKETAKKETKKETKVDAVVEIDKLLKQLSVEEDKMEKRRIRRNLRNLGHRGGLKNTKFDKAKETAKA